jgi:hypothetical protein
VSLCYSTDITAPCPVLVLHGTVDRKGRVLAKPRCLQEQARDICAKR